MPDSGLGFQVKVLETFDFFPFSIGSKVPRGRGRTLPAWLPTKVSFPCYQRSNLFPLRTAVARTESAGYRGTSLIRNHVWFFPGLCGLTSLTSPGTFPLKS